MRNDQLGCNAELKENQSFFDAFLGQTGLSWGGMWAGGGERTGTMYDSRLSKCLFALDILRN